MKSSPYLCDTPPLQLCCTTFHYRREPGVQCVKKLGVVAASRTGVVKRVEQVHLTISHQSHMKQDSGGVENKMSCKSRGYTVWNVSGGKKIVQLAVACPEGYTSHQS